QAGVGLPDAIALVLEQRHGRAEHRQRLLNVGQRDVGGRPADEDGQFAVASGADLVARARAADDIAAKGRAVAVRRDRYRRPRPGLWVIAGWQWQAPIARPACGGGGDIL